LRDQIACLRRSSRIGREHFDTATLDELMNISFCRERFLIARRIIARRRSRFSSPRGLKTLCTAQTGTAAFIAEGQRILNRLANGNPDCCCNPWSCAGGGYEVPWPAIVSWMSATRIGSRTTLGLIPLGRLHTPAPIDCVEKPPNDLRGKLYSAQEASSLAWSMK